MSNYKNLGNIELNHLSDFRDASKSTNCHIINLDGDLIVFSYSTIIALMVGYKWYIVNPETAPEHTKINSATTRTHINAISNDKSIRIPYDKFQQLLIDSKVKVTVYMEEE